MSRIAKNPIIIPEKTSVDISNDFLNIKGNHGEINFHIPVGFKVEKNSIPNEVNITHLSLFDKSIEGIELKNKPIFSVQYHPEASPGPQDSKYLFNKFINYISKEKKYAKKKRS